MKTEVKTVKNELPYPKLMKHKASSLVVLFLNFGCGTVVTEYGLDNIGEFNTDWVMSTFEDLPSDQQVILQND